MQFERIKKNHKKEIIIGGLILVCVISAITITTTRAKYKITNSIDLAKGTINYKPYDFKIMALYKSEDGSNYTEINTMPSNGYVINEEKTYCTTDNKTQVKGKIKTENGKHYITELSKNDKCYLYFDKYAEPAGEKIIANATKGSGVPTFSKTSCTNGCEETTVGTYTINDGMYGGISTYWRGDVKDNYVKFANYCWRIIRINGDRTIRLIYDGTTCHANGTNTAESIATTKIAYNTSRSQSNYVGWTYTGTSQRTLSGTASNAKSQLESWYSSNITGTNAAKVADGKYCNDRNAQSGSTWAITPSSTFYYAAYKRTITDYAPTLSCPSSDIYTLSVGLITADEVELAGGRNNPGNTYNMSYYLYNGQLYWTMSPYYWNGDNSRAFVFRVYAYGELSYTNVMDDSNGLRPVINLRSDVTFSSGDGTLNNPYVVE